MAAFDWKNGKNTVEVVDGQRKDFLLTLLLLADLQVVEKNNRELFDAHTLA